MLEDLKNRAVRYLVPTGVAIWLVFLPWPAPLAHASGRVCEYHHVGKIIDGDTFVIDNGERVRLIGIDTPETADPRVDVEWYGIEAAAALEDLIGGKEVCLGRDPDGTIDRDKYGRLLRYAWVDDVFVNRELLLRGYAFAYTRYPFRYLEEFRRAQERARESGAGLWNVERRTAWEEERRKALDLLETCGTEGTICPWSAVEHLSEPGPVTVRFLVRKTHDTGDKVFLNSENDYRDGRNFTAVIIKARSQSDIDPRKVFLGKVIDVRGRVRSFKGRAEIIVRDLSRISVVQP